VPISGEKMGWTGTVAKLIRMFGVLDSRRTLEGGVKGFMKAQADQTTGAHLRGGR